VKDTIQLAWAAGFTDGEGYVGLTRCFDRKRGYYTYRVQFEVAQVHEQPIRLMYEMFNRVGRIRHYTNKHRGYWTWRVFNQDAIEVIKVLLPYLIVKREQAQLCIEYQFTDRRIDGLGRWRKTPADVVARRAALWAACVELNGGRAVQAERLSEKTPTGNAEGGAIVRSASNKQDAEGAEMTPRLRAV